MTTIAYTTSQSFFEAAFEKIATVARQHRIRRAQRIALATLMDMGPYYITDLVNLLGPVKAVQAMSLTPAQQRPIRSEPKKGQLMPVKVFTHVTGTLQFASGALVQVSLSFDVPKHTHKPIEIYGTDASMQVPDPNMFGGEVKLAAPRAQDWDDVPVKIPYADANYRSLGVADMRGSRTAKLWPTSSSRRNPREDDK